MKIKKNTFYTLVLELFFPSTANCRKLKIKKNPPPIWRDAFSLQYEPLPYLTHFLIFPLKGTISEKFTFTI
jgi:hypothetical protein